MIRDWRQEHTDAHCSRYFLTVTVLILLAGFALRAWDLAGPSLWIDETTTDFRVRDSVRQTFAYLAENASQGPFYYVVMHLFPRHNELLLRLPSVWAGMIGLALLIALVKRIHRRYELALLAGALLAFNPYHVWLSRTARAYSLFFVLALLSSFAFLLLLQGHRRRVTWSMFVISSMGAYLTHHFALALPAAQYVLFAFILRGNRGFFRRWIAAQLVAGTPLLLYAIHLMRQDVVAVGSAWIPQPGVGDLVLTLWNLIVGYDGPMYWYIVPGLVAGMLGLSLGLRRAWRGRRLDRATFYWFWLLIVPLMSAFVVSVALRPFYVDRYFIVFLPAVLVLVLKGWETLGIRRVQVFLAAIVVTSGAVNIGMTLYRGDHEREDWRAAARLIDRKQQPGDGMLVESPDRLIAILYYLETKIDYAWLSSGVGDAAGLASQFDQPVQRLWVVYRNPYDDGHRQNVMPGFDPFSPHDSPLSEWIIEHRGQVLNQHEFNGVTLLLVDVGDALAETVN